VTTNIVLLVHNRPELTRQAISAMLANAGSTSLNLTVVDDGSTEIDMTLERYVEDLGCVRVLRLWPAIGIVGLCRNLGILASEKLWGRGDYLYLADNDCYCLSGWLDTLLLAFSGVDGQGGSERQGVRLLGGYAHPFHRPNAAVPATATTAVHSYDAVQGISHLMRWKTWDDFGPFDANAQGTNQSEDFAFCRRIVEAGYLVGSVYPRVILNCGLVDSYGKPCVGYDAVRSELLHEISSRGLEGKVFYQEILNEGNSAYQGSGCAR
jgi:GT2 family glycosyltransferase